MTDTPIKSENYALIIDERRNYILGSLLQAAMASAYGRAIFDILCQQYPITKEEAASFIKEWSDREHDLGWCKSIACKHKKEGV